MRGPGQVAEFRMRGTGKGSRAMSDPRGDDVDRVPIPGAAFSEGGPEVDVDDSDEPLDPPTARAGRRLGRGILLGLGIGALAGVAIGTILGATMGTGGATKFWTFFVGAFVACSAVGALVGSYSSLESPQPGREPSDTERPLRDTDGLTTEEQPGRPAPRDD